MKKSLESTIRKYSAVFAYYAKHPQKCEDLQKGSQLSENFHVLGLRAKQTERELNRIKKRCQDPELVPGLFKKCVVMCKKGVLPDENGIIDFFEKNGGLSGTECSYLPLAVTCALIHVAAQSVRSKSKVSLKHFTDAVISLRKMAETDFDFITANLYEPEKILINDAAYVMSDERTKSIYRRRIAHLAFRTGKTERETAKKAFEKAEKNGAHIGEYLFSGRKTTKRGYLYLLMEVVMPLVVSFCLSVLFENVLVGVLCFFPLWEILRYPIENASLSGVPAKGIMRFSVDSEAVSQVHTLITVSTVMPSADKFGDLEQHLEQLYLSNCTGNIRICCLADFKGAGMPRKPEDKTLLKAAKEITDKLNRRHDGGFIFAVRPRVYSKTQNEFIGKERKMGAITELIRAIKGNEKGFSLLHGDIADIEKVKYLIALDADTDLVFDSARELIAAAEHPLNRPQIRNGRVVSGYGILIPKTETELIDENSTVFNLLMSGDTGIGSYDTATGERYRDLFSESIFCGKGLIDVEAYHTLLESAFEKETVLSHDILEGGYLRVGYVPEARITEAFPKTVISYYRRLHRWVRGDWQNIRFIFGKNSFNFVSRFKIFDNLRRSITPIMCVLALMISLLTESYSAVCITLCSVIALSARDLYCAVRSFIHGGINSISGKYHSKTVPFTLGAFIRSFTDVAFSARESAVCSDAIIKALWRFFISKKRLLEWTPAAQSESGGVRSSLISCIPSMLVSLVLFLLGNPFHRMVALVILADIPLTLLTSSKIRLKHTKVTEKQREKLLSYASSMWGFFEDLCTRENNFLPPDNIQFSPVKATAHRTSPTNIGLMLTSFLAARDMGFISNEELCMRITLSLNSVEKLEKYEGNLLNWYDTKTLQPLSPRFVSTVDSGNFLCALVALKEGLREYLSECPALSNVITRIETLIAQTDLRPLFNQKRQLFHIGLDPDSGQKSNSYYDLYMSEARITSYFAVANRMESVKHWGALGRIFVRQGRFTGLASWTGTMFEYFMPNLFLPSPYGSLSHEALRFCLYCQKKAMGRMPFGISESGFYAFDRDLNYQYKAHGVKKLALCSTQGTEKVVSPYSTFLTLNEAPSLSVRNLEKLEKSGVTGIYGFYEAVDFGKTRGTANPSVVRSYMAHHVGMSIVAVDNRLHGSCMQKRFMRDKIMKGAESLLKEKFPTDADIFEGIKTEGITNVRERVHGKNIVIEHPDSFSPEAMLLTNGRLSVNITDCGTGVTVFNGTDITVNSNDHFNRPQGVFGVFKTENEVFSFTEALDHSNSSQYRAEFSKEKAEHTAKRGNVFLKMKTSVMSRYDCELREFTVENTSRKNPLCGNLIIYFEPCMENREAFAAHPMFSKLFLVDEWDEENSCYLFSRSSSASKNAYGMAVGLLKNGEICHESSRERVLKSPQGIFSLGELHEFKGTRGNPDCCCAFSARINLGAGEKAVFTLAIAVAEDKESALDTLITVRTGKDTKKIGENPFYTDTPENSFARKILSCAVAPGYSCSLVCGERSNYRKSDLWSFGISGANPIFTVEIDNEDDIERSKMFIKINKILRNCGVKTDLAIIFDDEDKYALPMTNAIISQAQKEDCGLMIGVSGGVHIVNSAAHSYEEMSALRKTAVFAVKANETTETKQKSPFRPLKYIDKKENNNCIEKATSVKQYNFTEGKISIKKTAKNLDIPWTMVFANRSFGTMVSDKALGFTWSLNSRENKLTPWYNDLMSDNRGELLILKYNNVLYDLIAISDAEFTPYSAVWKATVCDLDFRIETVVASKGTAKKCTVEIKNNSLSEKKIELMYYTLPVLGVDRNGCGMIHARLTENGVVSENPFAEIKGVMYLSCREGADLICLSQKDFYEGKFVSSDHGFVINPCIAVGKKIVIDKNDKAFAEFYLTAAASEKAAILMPAVADFRKMILNPKRISSKNASLNLFFNSFLYSQVKQSRFFGKTGFYQCSGAYGFRDQLQDCLAFTDTEPNLVRTHIARCASVQFEQGDVLHWWHVIPDKKQIIKGVRTRCSDDMLWLPYTCIKYYEMTGDIELFNTQVPYIVADELSEGENERYIIPERTKYRESVLFHCIRAVDRAMNFGKNGLPLIGSCDWNDGMNRIGAANAESVWLAMFMIIVLDGMSKILNEFGMSEKGEEYARISANLRNLVEEKAWCGDRYARILTEDGSALYKDRDFVDILPQAFAVFAGLGKNGRRDIALNTALNRLYDGKTIKLLSPPFDNDDKNFIGYIASYPNGIRENGGQYTHAAVWLAMALFEADRAKEGEKLLNSINPMSYYTDEKSAIGYRAEVFVLSGDVSCGKGVDGRAGWSHFTGSAAWFYRCMAENYPHDNVKNDRFTTSKKDAKNKQK